VEKLTEGGFKHQMRECLHFLHPRCAEPVERLSPGQQVQKLWRKGEKLKNFASFNFLWKRGRNGHFLH
jgi:hypothetical protein